MLYQSAIRIVNRQTNYRVCLYEFNVSTGIYQSTVCNYSHRIIASLQYPIKRLSLLGVIVRYFVLAILVQKIGHVRVTHIYNGSTQSGCSIRIIYGKYTWGHNVKWQTCSDPQDSIHNYPSVTTNFSVLHVRNRI